MSIVTHLVCLPPGWVRTTLGELTQIVQGQSPPSSTYNDAGEGLPFYQGKLEFGSVYPTPRKWCSTPKKVAKKGDVLVSVRAPVGPTNICPAKSCIGRGLAAVRPVCEVPALFLLYLLRTNETRLAGKGTGSTFSAISGDDLRALDVTLPSLPEQRRIVARIEELFSKLDAGVEELKKAKAQLKRYRQSVLKAAFSGELTSEWRKRRATSHEPIETAAMLLERIKAERRKMQGEKHKDLPLDMSELPALPKLWSWAKLGQVATVVRGASPRPKGDPKYFGGTIPWIMISDITREKGKSISKTKDTVTDAGATKSRLLKAGTLILSNSGTVCVPKFLAVDGCIHDGFVAFLDIPVAINQLYLFHFFNYVRPRITNENRQGVTQVNLNTTIVNNMVFPLSPLEEQEAIAESVEAALSVAENAEGTLDAGLKQAARLRQAILKRAFEGKLVPQDPSDEPAEKLLERIRAEKEERVAGAKRKREAAVGRTRRRRQT